MEFLKILQQTFKRVSPRSFIGDSRENTRLFAENNNWCLRRGRWRILSISHIDDSSSTNILLRKYSTTILFIPSIRSDYCSAIKLFSLSFCNVKMYDFFFEFSFFFFLLRFHFLVRSQVSMVNNKHWWRSHVVR